MKKKLYLKTLNEDLFNIELQIKDLERNKYSLNEYEKYIEDIKFLEKLKGKREQIKYCIMEVEELEK